MKWESLGGVPVCMLQIVGNGLGADNFLLTDDSIEFVCEIFKLIRIKNWHVIKFNRISDALFFEQLVSTVKTCRYKFDVTESIDYLIRLPGSYAEYLGSRSRKFRRNINHADKLLNSYGNVEFVTVDPYKESVRVQEVGEEIAKTSWQYKAGLSHFNRRNGGTFYSNLIESGQGTGGEDFNILLVDGRPVAYLLGCRRGRTYYAVDTAFHADFKNVSVGRILFGKVIEKLINEKQVDIFDFEGAGEYKDHYANDTKLKNNITIYNNTFYASVINIYRKSMVYEYLKKAVSR
jgi:CelD/BcsL family acetyltransferase involved in cellulose biosynthesis